MDKTMFCPLCTQAVRYANTGSGARWVHVENGSHLSAFPTRHDANTYAPGRLLDKVEVPERVVPYIATGIVAEESCPEQHFWRWLVLRPELLPTDLRTNYEEYGEIRWYPDR